MSLRVRGPSCMLVLGLTATLIASAVGTAEAADPRRSRQKMVELNKEALLSYDVKDWLTARELLQKALREAKLAGLEENNMTARTYVHLGAVQWAGFRDQAGAIQNFVMAKKIRPDIEMTPAIETSELKSLFEQASGEPQAEGGAASPVSPHAPSPSPPPPPVATPESLPGGDEGPNEPDVPATRSAPLMCTVPATITPNTEFTFRCSLDPGLTPELVQLHYRSPGAKSYEALAMRRTAKGWYTVTLPASETKPGALQIYFDARDESDKQLASNGQIDSPSVIAIREGGSDKAVVGRDDPMAHIKAMIKAEQYEAGLHRRRAGAIWVGVGGGRGWGYVPSGHPEWEQQVELSAMATTTGLYHLLPEIGYMVTDNFALAVQGRLEFIEQEQATYVHPDTQVRLTVAPNLENEPATKAPALFARAIGYTDISSGGNLRLLFSADLGAGYLRLPVRPTKDADVYWDPETLQYVPDYGRTIVKTDTRAVSGFLAGTTLGMVWHLSRHFALSLTGRVLTGLPNWGVVTEGALSLEVAFGGVQGSTAKSDEGDDVVTREEPVDTTDEWDVGRD